MSETAKSAALYLTVYVGVCIMFFRRVRLRVLVRERVRQYVCVCVHVPPKAQLRISNSKIRRYRFPGSVIFGQRLPASSIQSKH